MPKRKRQRPAGTSGTTTGASSQSTPESSSSTEVNSVVVLKEKGPRCLRKFSETIEDTISRQTKRMEAVMNCVMKSNEKLDLTVANLKERVQLLERKIDED